MQTNIYFETQESALQQADQITKARGYIPQYPDRIWIEPVSYGNTVKYSIPLLRSGGFPTRKYLNISLYRMDSGRYELTCYLN